MAVDADDGLVDVGDVSVQVGDQVGVFLWPGRLGTPWRMVNALSDY